MEQFMHGRNNNTHLTVSLSPQALGEGAHEGVVPGSDDSRQVERCPQRGVALLAEAALTMDGTARGVLTGRDADKGGYLASAGKGAHIAQFRQHTSSSQVANAGDGGQQVALLFQVRMVVEVVIDLLLEIHD